jgi:hypothetical protein
VSAASPRFRSYPTRRVKRKDARAGRRFSPTGIGERLRERGDRHDERDSNPDLSYTCSTEFTPEIETVKLGLQRARS